MIGEEIKQLLQEALQSAGLSASPGQIQLEHPADLAHGDYASNVALIFAKDAAKSPRELADLLAVYLNENRPPSLERIEVAGPGFINFTLSSAYLHAVTKRIIAEGDAWGRNETLAGKKIIMEYAQPNPFKPFHIGHLMSTTLGESLSRLIEFSGATIFRANYQGDMGPHVAKCLWGLNKLSGDPHDVNVLGEAYVVGNNAYEESPEAKEEIETLNKRLYENDPALKEVYNAGREASLARFEELYKLLNTHFDAYFFESETGPVGIAMVKEGLERGIFEESEGAVVYRGEKKGLHTRVFINSKGIQTYEAKELGLVKMKNEKFPFDLNVTTVAVEQDGYFKVVEAALAELWPEMAEKYTHVSHGMMQLLSGKMSSRKGNVITGESLIEDMRQEVKEKMGGRELPDPQAVADAVAIAGIKYAVLRQGTGKNIIFDPEKSMSLEGDSGPYVQYAHTRALSVLKKAQEEGAAGAVNEGYPLTALERLLYRFPEVVLAAQKEREPHYVASYVTELAASFNSWYANTKILDGTESSAHKLALTEAVAVTLRNGLWLLGIAAPEAM